MANTVDSKQVEKAFQFPRSIKELKGHLRSEDSVIQLVTAIACEEFKQEMSKWAEKEPLCVRELIREVFVEGKFLSAIAPLFSACLKENDHLKRALLKTIELSGKKEGGPAPGSLKEHIHLIAASPKAFFELFDKLLEAKNYPLLFELTQYCSENPGFCKASRSDLSWRVSQAMSKDDPTLFADLLDKGLFRYRSGWRDSDDEAVIDPDSLLIYKVKESLIPYIDRGLVKGRKISDSRFEDFNGGSVSPEGWDGIQLLIANGAILDKKPENLCGGGRYYSKKQWDAYPFKREAYQLMKVRQRLYENELSGEDLLSFNRDELKTLWTWLTLDRQAVGVMQKSPDFFKALLKKLPSSEVDFSIVLPKFHKAGLFDLEVGRGLLIQAIDDDKAGLVKVLMKLGVPFNEAYPKSKLTLFQHVLQCYVGWSSFDRCRLLELLISHRSVDCNERFPSGKHPIEVLLGEDLYEPDMSRVRARGGRQEGRLSGEKRRLLEAMLERGAKLSDCKKLSLIRMIGEMNENDIPVFKTLISHGISLEGQTERGSSVLHLLLSYSSRRSLDSKKLGLLNLVISQDPKRFASVRNSRGLTPLEMVISEGKPALVLLLLLWGVVPEGFLEMPNVDHLTQDPLVKRLVDLFSKKQRPSSPKELAPWLTLKRLGLFFGDAVLKEQRSIEGASLEGNSSADSLSFLSALLSAAQSSLSVSDEKLASQFQEAKGRLEEAALIGRLLDFCLVLPEFRSQHLPVLCSVVREQIEALVPGETFLLPSGWAGLEGKGHAMLLEIRRNDNATFSLKAINTGSGVERHAQHRTPLKNLIHPVRHFDQIKKEQLFNTAFFEALFAPQAYLPQEKAFRYTDKDLYNVLFFRFEQNAVPLAEEIPEDFVTVQRSGTCSLRVGLAYLQACWGTEAYKRGKIHMDHTLFQAINWSDLIEANAFDPAFVMILEHAIRRSSLNLHKQQGRVSSHVVEVVAREIQEVADTYPQKLEHAIAVSGEAESSVDQPQDSLNQAVGSIGAARGALFIDLPKDEAVLVPSAPLDLPWTDFSSFDSGLQWIEAFDRLIQFFDGSSKTPFDESRFVPTHLTTQALSTLPLPHRGVFHVDIDQGTALGSLSVEEKRRLAHQIKELARRYATAFYCQMKEEGKTPSYRYNEAERVEQYVCLNKLYAVYWRLMLHLGSGNVDGFPLQNYGVGISHLEALENSIHLPTYSPRVSAELSDLIAFFKASSPDGDNPQKKPLLEIGSWKGDGGYYNNKLQLPLEGDLGEVALWDHVYPRISEVSWSSVDMARERYQRYWGKPDVKQWRLAHLFVKPEDYLGEDWARYTELREMAFICWSFKGMSHDDAGVSLSEPHWTEAKQIECDFKAKGFDSTKKMVDAAQEAKNCFVVGKGAHLSLSSEATEALKVQEAQNHYTINKTPEKRYFYEIAECEQFAVDRLLSYYEEHIGLFNQQNDQTFFQLVLFGRDRLEKAIRQDIGVVTRLQNLLAQSLCEFELQLLASPSRHDLLKTVIFLKALQHRVAEYIGEIPACASFSNGKGSDLSKWIEHRLALLPALDKLGSDNGGNALNLYWLWFCAQPSSAWEDPSICRKAIVHLAQANYLEADDDKKGNSDPSLKARAIAQLFSHGEALFQAFSDRALLAATAHQVFSLYVVFSDGMQIEGSFPQVVVRDRDDLYEMSLLRGMVVKNRNSLKDLRINFQELEKECFEGRSDKVVQYRGTSHKEEKRDRYRFHFHCGGKIYLSVRFQNGEAQYENQITWEREGETFVYVPLSKVPAELNCIPVRAFPKKRQACYWINTQEVSPIAAIVENKVNNEEEVVIFSDGSAQRAGKEGRWRLLPLETMSEGRVLSVLQPKQQVGIWESCERPGRIEIECLALQDRHQMPLAFEKNVEDAKFRSINFPGYRLSDEQTVKGLGSHFPYAVIENALEEKNVILPVRGWSDVVVSAGDQKDLSEQCYGIEVLSVDAQGQLTGLTVRQKLLLSYHFLGARQYERAVKLLKSAQSSSVYTPEELQMFAWIFLHDKQTKDHSPRAKALSLLAAHMVRENLHLFPDVYRKQGKLCEISGFYAKPSEWVQFWKANAIYCVEGQEGGEAIFLWMALSTLLIEYYEVSNHCTGEFQLLGSLLTPFQEAEWLKEILNMIKGALDKTSDPQLSDRAQGFISRVDHRLQHLVFHKPDALEAGTSLPQNHPTILVPHQDEQKKESSSIGFEWLQTRDQSLEEFDQALAELNRVRPERKLKENFSLYYAVTQKGTELQQKRLLRFLNDMQYDPDETNQVIRAILLSQMPPYNTYQVYRDKISNKINDLVKGISSSNGRSSSLSSFSSFSSRSADEEKQLLSYLQQWYAHYFPVPSFKSPQITLPETASLIPDVPVSKTQKLSYFKEEVADQPIGELNRLADSYFDVELKPVEPIAFPPLPSALGKDPYFQMRASSLREDIALGSAFNAGQSSYRLKRDADFERLKRELVENYDRLRKNKKALKAEIRRLVSHASGGPQDQLNAQLLRLGKKQTAPELDECIALFVQADLSLYRQRLPFLSEQDCLALHQAIGRFLKEATEEQRWGRCVQLAKKEEFEQLGSEMKKARAYDPSSHPEFMVFEYNAQFSLRQEQVDNLIKMTTVDAEGKFPPFLLQMIMNAGKTSVLGKLLSLMKADGYHLSILFIPRSLFDTNAVEMKEGNAAFFGQRGDVFVYNRGKQYFNLPHLRRVYNQLVETIRNRRYVMMTPETYLSMQNQYVEAREKIAALKEQQGLNLIERRKNEEEIAGLEEPIAELKKILQLFQTRGAATFDEIDMQNAPRKELNYPGVRTEHLDRISIDLVGALYEIAACDPEIKQIGIDLYHNTQASLLPTQIKQVQKLLAAKMVHAIAGKFTWCQHLGLETPCRRETLESLQHYFAEADSTAPDWLAALHRSSVETDRMAAERIVLVRQEILKWLPSCWKFSANEHFSRSKEHPEYLAAKPNICANTPNENAEMAHCWELVNKTLQLYVSCGADLNQAKMIIQSLQKLAVIQRGKLKIESGSDPRLAIEQTQAAQLFKRLMSQQQGQEKDQLMQIDANTPDSLERIHQALSSGRPEAIRLIIDYVTNNILPELEFHIDQIDNNSMNLGGAVASEQGYSGTIENLYIFSHQFTKRPKETVILDGGANGRVIDILCRRNRTVHKVGAGLKTPQDLMAKLHAMKPKEEQDAFKAWIDIGAYFKGQSNVQIAKSFLTYFSELGRSPIEGILYYDDETNQLACLKKGHENAPILIGGTDGKAIYSATSLRPGQLFTFYDQFHTTGSNIIQAPEAKAFYTVGAQTVLRDQLQGGMRMRSLLLQTQELEGVVPEEMVPFISHQIEAEIEEVPTIEQLLLFGEVNGLLKDREDNLKVFLSKLKAAVRKYARGYLYTATPKEEEAFYAVVRHFFVRSVKEELFEQYGGIPSKTDQERYIKEKVVFYLDKIEEMKPFLGEEAAQALAQEIREIADLSSLYLPLEIDGNSANENATVEKMLEIDKKSEKVTELEMQAQRELVSGDGIGKAKEREWDFSSYHTLMQQLCSFQMPSAGEKPWAKRLSDAMSDKVDLMLFSECFSQQFLLSANFLETGSGQQNILDKIQKTPLEALLFLDYQKRPHLLLLTSKEAEAFAAFIERENVPLAILNANAQVVVGEKQLVEENPDIEQLLVQKLFFSGRFRSLEQDRWEAGLDCYLADKRGLKRDLFEGVLLDSAQAMDYQNSTLSVKLNAPSKTDSQTNSLLTQLKRAKFLLQQKRFAQAQALIDQQMKLIQAADLVELSMLIDLACMAAAHMPGDWVFGLFQQIFTLISFSIAEGKPDLIEKLIGGLQQLSGSRLKSAVTSFILQQQGLSDRQVEAVFSNTVFFKADHKVEIAVIADAIYEMLLFLDNSSYAEKMRSCASQMLVKFMDQGRMSYNSDACQVCRNVFEALIALMRNPALPIEDRQTLESIAAPYFETYLKYLASQKNRYIVLSVLANKDDEPHTNAIYDGLASQYYGISPKLDQLIETILIDSVLNPVSSFGSDWQAYYNAFKKIDIPYAQERTENLRLRLAP